MAGRYPTEKPAITVALTSITASTILALNLITPISLPPPLNPYPIRLTDAVSAVVSIINPLAGAVGSVIGHFVYDYLNLGFPGAIPALFASWCYFLRSYSQI